MTSYVRAMYDFSGEPGSSELSIVAGDILTVTRSDVGEGWWEGKNSRGQVGLFPAAYVEVMSAAEARQLTSPGTDSSPPDPFGSVPVAPRYDPTPDGDDDSMWSDSDDNETYTEIAPPGGRSTAARASALSHSNSNYDNRHLPVAPSDDTFSLSSGAAGANAGTVKKGMFAKSSDSYILGLTNIKEKIPECELAQITQVDDSIFQWTQNHSPYSVVVASPKKESKFKGMKTFIAYQLTPSFNNISVSRRYKHFDWLHERLAVKFCLVAVPPLPDKQISGRYEEQFVEHRRVQLQEFVDWVCRHPVISKCEVWYHFLTCTTDEKIWKSGKRKAERDPYIGVNYCLAIRPPEKILLNSIVDPQMESGQQFIHAMDGAVRNLNNISNDMAKRSLVQSKKDFQRIGDGLSELAKSLGIDERRAKTLNGVALSESVGRIGGIYIGIGQMFGDQPKHDWIPLSDRLHIYRGVLSCYPDIFSVHKGAIQKRKDCERSIAEGKMSNAQIQDVQRRTEIVSYTVLAELTHFKTERDNHLKQTLKNFIAEQIKFYQGVVARLQEAHRQIE